GSSGGGVATCRGLRGREGEGHEVVELLEVERLGDIREDAAGERLGRGSDVLIAGDHDDRDGDAESADLLEELEPAHPRHVHVEDDEVVPPSQEHHRRIGAVVGRRDLVGVPVLELLEELLEHLDDRALVVDDQDPLGHARSITRGGGAGRSRARERRGIAGRVCCLHVMYRGRKSIAILDRKSTRLNSSHVSISYAVFCLKKKKKKYRTLFSVARYRLQTCTCLAITSLAHAPS